MWYWPPYAPQDEIIFCPGEEDDQSLFEVWDYHICHHIDHPFDNPGKNAPHWRAATSTFSIHTP